MEFCAVTIYSNAMLRPDPARGANSAPPDLLAEFGERKGMGKGRVRKGRGGKVSERKRILNGNDGRKGEGDKGKGGRRKGKESGKKGMGEGKGGILCSCDFSLEKTLHHILKCTDCCSWLIL